MRLTFFSRRKKMSMGEALIAALEKGREVCPNEFDGIGGIGEDATCAIGAIAIGLGWEARGKNKGWSTSICAEWIKSFYPKAPIQQLFSINDSALDGERDEAVNKFLLGY
jgi:hypothetical protein